MNLFSLFGKKTFPKGIHPEGFKEETHDHQARRLTFPTQVILPLSQNIGKPAVSIVHPGQQVHRGELIAEADGFMSVPLHASVTGTVKKIDLVPNARGGKEQAIFIDTALSSTQALLPSEAVDFEKMSRKELIQAV
ncbi:MAG: electron transport complex subunit RsxC, partial [Methylococcales bacterium]